MRKTKSGAPALPKVMWAIKACTHRDFATELLGLMEAELLPLLEAATNADLCTLADALLHLHRMHSDRAGTCSWLAAATKRGAPKKSTHGYGPELAELLGMDTAKKRRPGRPTKWGPAMHRKAFEIVERRRAALAERGKPKSTIKAAIDSLNAEIVCRREGITVKNQYASLYSAYRRGKQLERT